MLNTSAWSACRAAALAAASLSTVACSGATPRPPATPAPSLAARTEDAVHVSFYARDEELWSLRDGSGTMVCQLPCSAWVRPDAHLTLVDDGTSVDGAPIAFEVPAQLPAVAGDELTLTVDRTHAWGSAGKVIAAPLTVIFGLMGLGFTGLGIASLATGSKDTTTSTSACTSTGSSSTRATACTTGTSHGVAAGVESVAIGVGALAVATATAYWFFHAHAGGVAFEAPPTLRSAVRLTPGGLALGLRGAHVVVGPSGVAGTF